MEGSHNESKDPTDSAVFQSLATEVPIDSPMQVDVHPYDRDDEPLNTGGFSIEDFDAQIMKIKELIARLQQGREALPSKLWEDTNTKLSEEEWTSLSALHTTILEDYYDLLFFQSQHPNASDKINDMPSQMWKQSIQSFLGLHKLPQSYDWILSFGYLAHGTLSLLIETVPRLHADWVFYIKELALHIKEIATTQETADYDIGIWNNVVECWSEKT